MSRTKKIVIAAAAVVLIAALTLTLCLTLLRQPEPVRDMSEVASRGSFVMKVESQRAILPFEGGESFVFQTYEEFTSNPISELILYSDYENIDSETIRFDYKAKNERYNQDYFEENDLLVAFFEATVNMISHIVKDVQLEGNVCTVEVYGDMPTGSWGVQEEQEALYACFLEKGEWARDVTTTVKVEEIFVSESVPSHYYDENLNPVDAPDQEYKAYLFTGLGQLEQFIADDPYVKDGDLLAFSLAQKYTEDFFASHDLLLMVLPGTYFAETMIEGPLLIGVRLYSDHYMTAEEQESLDDNFACTAVISVAVEKGFSYTELQYRYCRYYEWEDGLTGRDIETEPVTLTEQTSGTAYRVYAQSEAQS